MHLIALSAADIIGFLSFASSFLLRSFVVFFVFWLASLLLYSAANRFVLWMMYLVGVCLYWLCGVAGLVFAAHSTVMRDESSALSTHAVIVLSSSREPFWYAFTQDTLPVYILVVLCLLVFGIWQRVKLHSFLSARYKPNAEILDAVGRVAVLVNAHPARVWLLPGLSSPASAGWLRPAIYLPVETEAASNEELTGVLLHEWFHLFRRDALWEDIGRFCRLLLFFHPLVHWAFASCRREREYECDLKVLHYSGIDRDVYAQTLLVFGLAQVAQKRQFSVRFGASGSFLRRRVERILSGSQPISLAGKILQTSVVAALLLAVTVLLPCFWVRFEFRSKPAYASIEAIIPAAARVKNFPRHRIRASQQVRSANSVMFSDPVQSEVVPAIPVAQTVYVEQRKHYQLMPSAEAPLSDPPSSTDQTEDDGSVSGKVPSHSPRGASVATATTVITDVVDGLIRMGGHGSDHDRD